VSSVMARFPVDWHVNAYRVEASLAEVAGCCSHSRAPTLAEASLPSPVGWGVGQRSTRSKCCTLSSHTDMHACCLFRCRATSARHPASPPGHSRQQTREQGQRQPSGHEGHQLVWVSANHRLGNRSNRQTSDAGGQACCLQQKPPIPP
jgi:hypothetical protein